MRAASSSSRDVGATRCHPVTDARPYHAPCANPTHLIGLAVLLALVNGLVLLAVRLLRLVLFLFLVLILGLAWLFLVLGILLFRLLIVRTFLSLVVTVVRLLVFLLVLYVIVAGFVLLVTGVLLVVLSPLVEVLPVEGLTLALAGKITWNLSVHPLVL
jgi:hypothetical protein